MLQTTLYDAKARLSALVEEVSQTGQEILITRHGKPIVRLAPLQPVSWAPIWDAPERLRPKLCEDPTIPTLIDGFPVSDDDPV